MAASCGIPKQQQSEVVCMMRRSLPVGIIHYYKNGMLTVKKEVKTIILIKWFVVS
jgi:hypothetical protein